LGDDAGKEQRRAARAFPVLPCAALRSAELRSAGNAQGSAGNARARRCAFLHPYDARPHLAPLIVTAAHRRSRSPPPSHTRCSQGCEALHRAKKKR
jgi:hypothetical protein